MLKVRRAELSDLDFMTTALYQLNKLHHDAIPQEFKPPEEIARHKNLASYLSEEKCFAYIAENRLEPIGFIAGHVRELISPITKSVQMGSIDELFVDESQRSLGVGAKLLKAFEDECAARSATDVFVEIWEFNSAAIKFYEKHGMKTHVRWARKSL